jgi:Tfp pilus assembly protein PilF
MAKETFLSLISGCCSSFSNSVALIALIGSLALPLPAQTDTLAQAPQSPPPASPVAQPVSTNVTVPVARPALTLKPEEFGDLQMVRKQYQAALAAYLQVSPKTSTVWNKIGIANQQMFITEEAKKSYKTALKLDPKNPEVLNNLGSVYYSLKSYGDAEHMYRKALKISPKSALIYKNLGTDLLAENKFKKGWECYQAALSMDPGIFERINQLRIGEPTPTQKRGAMNYYLAKSYARVGMPDLAVGYLRMAIDEGFTDRKRVLADKEFAILRGLSSFERMIAEQQMQ